METREYATMAEYETTYWWYRGQRSMILDRLASLPLAAGLPVLDAGCGTGTMRTCVAERLGRRVVGVDLAAAAAAFWNEEGTKDGCLASVDQLPFADGTFALVYSIDVLCCREVDPARAVAEFARVLAPGGHLVLIVPAYQWLLSEHDRAVHAARRFNRAGVRAVLADAGLTVRYVTNMFPSFLPAIAAVRLVRRNRGLNGEGARSDLRPISKPLNRMLYSVTQVERRLLRYTPFPFGTTLMAVAVRKEPLT